MTDDKSTFGKWLASHDSFRSIPLEFRRTTKIGGVLTLLTYALIVILLLAEIGAFMRTSHATIIKLDDNNDKLLQINFDIIMHELPCKYLRIAVFDSFGEERVDSHGEEFHYIPINAAGISKGQKYASGDIQMLEHDPNPELTAEEEQELDSDWASSDDHFMHKSFKDAVIHHEFTLVLFYADWCSHCRNFHPTWNTMVNDISMKEKFQNHLGHDLQVKLMKINCVDFSSACKEQQIHSYPTIRLYNNDYGKEGDEGTPVAFAGKRSIDNFRIFLTKNIARSNKERHIYVQEEHASMYEGCRVQGYLTVPRVPGEFHLEATADQDAGTLNPHMTNVSHRVNHLSFGDVARKFHDATKDILPADLLRMVGLQNISPLDGKSFIAESVNHAPQHYMKVVSTTSSSGSDVVYQVTHSDRISKVEELKIPQAKFMYDLSPMSVSMKTVKKRWYEFLTSLCAIIGGFYTVAKLTSRSVLSIVTKKEN